MWLQLLQILPVKEYKGKRDRNDFLVSYGRVMKLFCLIYNILFFRRSQSIREKILPRRSTSQSVEETSKSPLRDAHPDEKDIPVTPIAPLIRPRSPPKTRKRRSAPSMNTFVNPHNGTQEHSNDTIKEGTL